MTKEAPEMQYEDMVELARDGSAGDVRVLLEVYGKLIYPEPVDKKCLDVIVESVAASKHEKAEKQALISDYAKGAGVFALRAEVDPEAIPQLQESIIVLLETVKELTERVDTLEKAREADEKAAVKANSITNKNLKF